MAYCSKLKASTSQAGDLNAKADAIPAESNLKTSEKFLMGIYYINLVKNGENDNFSSYKLPTRKPWGKSDKSVKTVWTKLRYDPQTMLVNTGDFTYSKSIGNVSHSKINRDRVPFGTAFGCESDKNADGQARIDLRGTNFAVDDVFRYDGWRPMGLIKLSYNNQVVELNGGGFCGWVAPKSAALRGEEAAHTGGWDLKLKVIRTDNVFVSPEGNTYLNLVEGNMSSYKLPTRKPWGSSDSDQVTIWNKVRIDLDRLVLNTGDFTYTSSSGRVSHSKINPDKVPFGTAFGCEAPRVTDGTAKIDLTNTGFAIDDAFAFGGWEADGKVALSNNNQVALIKGGGYCGWMGPKAANDKGEEALHTGGWDIKVKRI